MKRPAVFFDRDNTLIVNDGYLGDPNGVVLVQGAADAVARARRLGFATVIVSNQSGVARGMFDEDAVHAVNARLDQMLAASNPTAVVDRHEFCPFHPDASIERYRQDSDLRKPKPGMILQAARTLALDLRRSWVIGDAPRDIEAGIAAGCRTILFHDPSLPKSQAAHDLDQSGAEFVCATLAEAMDYIEQRPADSHGQHDASDTHEPPPAPPREDAPTARGASMANLLAQPARPARGPAPTPSTSPAPATAPAVSTAKLEELTGQILTELRRRHEQPNHDFSVSRMLAVIVQMLAIATLILAYFQRGDNNLIAVLLVALTLQTMTIALSMLSKDARQ